MIFGANMIRFVRFNVYNMHWIKKLLFLLLLCVASCAKVVTPIGGPKDVTPPTVVKTTPENGSLNFSEKHIKISFDEYVLLNKPSENVIISPPLHTAPHFTMKGKNLLITLNDTLSKNTTYNIVFANGIKDYTEGNLLPYFQYSFSTGPEIDTGKLVGKVVDAQSLEPVAGVTICLYSQDVDSLPFTKLPRYLTKSNSEGIFQFSYIQESKYKVFALKDINSNFVFDLPNEGIAFVDTMVAATRSQVTEADSVGGQPMLNMLNLYYFVEEDTVQYFSSIMPKERGVYKFTYKLPIKEDPQIVSFLRGKVDHFLRLSPTRDTLTIYCKEPIVDSLAFVVQAGARLDTAILAPFKESAKYGRGKRNSETNLGIKVLHKGELYKPLTLQFAYPIRPIDSFEVTYIKKMKSGFDTITKWYSVPDSLVLQLPLPFEYEEKVSYSVQLVDSIFWGYNGITNDSLTFDFSVKSHRDYGNLLMNFEFENQECDYLVLLLNMQGNIVDQQVIRGNREVKYYNLLPGNYRMKVVEDRNRNGKWDTGNYKNKQQPEPVYFFDKPIQIRGFWDLEETFRIDN